MDWFRWWHGTVTDPKFQWVARKSGQTVASVIAVWAVVLETGSNATQGNADATRGNVASLHCEDWDVAFGLEDGSVQSIFDAMVAKGLIRDLRIVAWDARQPKREDGGDPNTGALSSTERSRLYREKKKRDATQGDEMQRDATQGNTVQRIEEIREEESKQNMEANASVDSNGVPPAADLLGTIPPTSMLCPVQRIVDAYHELMPENPRVKNLNDARRRVISARWKEAAKLKCKPFGYADTRSGLSAWRKFFSVCAQSEFLCGKARPQPGKPPFFADIDWLMNAANFTKILENKYHRDAA
jgi:hypothetical protein